MNYNFIEIGTSNFDTLAEDSRNSRGLSVEPIQALLSQVKVDSSNNVIKVCAALSETDGHDYIYVVPEADIVKYGLPQWVLSSSSIGVINPNVARAFREKSLDLSLVGKSQIKTISWKTLFEFYSVSFVDYVKVDAEGMDIKIIEWLFDYLEVSSMEHPTTVKFETREEMTDRAALKSLLERLARLGYSTERVGNDTIAKK